MINFIYWLFFFSYEAGMAGATLGNVLPEMTVSRTVQHLSSLKLQTEALKSATSMSLATQV